MCVFLGEISFMDEDEDEEASSGVRYKVNVKSKDYLYFHAKRKDGLYKKLIEDPGSSAVSCL